MKRDEILNAFRALAQSQGFYGRLLYDIMTRDDKDEVLSYLEAQNFKDIIDLIMFVEA